MITNIETACCLLLPSDLHYVESVHSSGQTVWESSLKEQIRNNRNIIKISHDPINKGPNLICLLMLILLTFYLHRWCSRCSQDVLRLFSWDWWIRWLFENIFGCFWPYLPLPGYFLPILAIICSCWLFFLYLAFCGWYLAKIEDECSGQCYYISIVLVSSFRGVMGPTSVWVASPNPTR